LEAHSIVSPKILRNGLIGLFVHSDFSELVLLWLYELGLALLDVVRLDRVLAATIAALELVNMLRPT
jgi:hypothetical protein